MEAADFLLIFSLLCVLLLVAQPMGIYLARVLGDAPFSWLRRVAFVEKGIYRLCGVDPTEEMNWKSYTGALLLFNACGLLLLLTILLLQAYLPMNAGHIEGMPLPLAINTAISFVTNTNWQAYSGEAAASYLTQMFGLGVQNFLSAATGIAVFAALARGLARKETHEIGNFWVDLVRTTLYVLLPLSCVIALVLMSQGVVQNFLAYLDATTLEGVMQKIPMGPAASQIAIKQLGSNGGGFFGVNSAHPFENPTGLSNAVEIFAMLLLPFALPFAFGSLVGDRKHGRILFGTMFVMFLCSLGAALYLESGAISALGQLPFLEGKESRFGLGASTLWTVATTATSNGSVNSMISSASPLTGGIAMFNIMLGEVIFGGVGCGVYGMVLFVLLTVFIAGLMVGRTPEYLGKKIEAPEIKWAVIGVLAPCAVILLLSALACMTQAGLSSLSSTGPHGLSEILYAFSSAAGNNGSTFGGLNANTPFYNLLIGLGMLIGRFAILLPVLRLLITA